jgi:hypothetical protein
VQVLSQIASFVPDLLHPTNPDDIILVSCLATNGAFQLFYRASRNGPWQPMPSTYSEGAEMQIFYMVAEQNGFQLRSFDGQICTFVWSLYCTKIYNCRCVLRYDGYMGVAAQCSRGR